jgi:putative transposase
MTPHPKQAYHPFIPVAFYLNILPENLLIKIPRSTRYDWQHKRLTELFGYDWYWQNQPLFHTLQAVAASRRLLQLNKALLRVIAIQRFLQRHKTHIRFKMFNAAAAAVTNIQKVQQVLGHGITLKLLQLTHQQYWQLRQKVKCPRSLFNLCIPKHPLQLLRSEISVIKNYCTDCRYMHWPLVSVWHQIIRDGAAAFHISTFYKYAGLLQIKRRKALHRRKNHHRGIRAAAPLQLLHADVTVFRTMDNLKAYIYIIQDNFSRAILQYTVSLQRKASLAKELLEKAHSLFLQPAGISACWFMTDDGSENYGPVQDFIKEAESPSLQHIVAQRDIAFSNSMIEAAHKNLKYRFLYHKTIADFNSLCNYLPQAIEDYNNRPHHVLYGLTPLETLHGKTIDKKSLHQQVIVSKTERIIKNKQEKCCNHSF